jgi:hypothetical protein
MFLLKVFIFLAMIKLWPCANVSVCVEDFEVAIFLRESGTRHSLLTKQKAFGKQGRMKSNSSKLTGADTAGIMIESDDEDATHLEVNLGDIPEVTEKTVEIEMQEEDTEKKLQLETSYEGFGIWGWVLCLLVTRKRGNKARTGAAAAGAASGQALMEEWMGTQMQAALDED